METPNTETTTKARKTGKKIERIALKSLCSALRIDPKAARRKLRKAGFSWHGMRERWLMTEKQAEAARNILKPPKAETKASKKSKPAPAADAPAVN